MASHYFAMFPPPYYLDKQRGGGNMASHYFAMFPPHHFAHYQQEHQRPRKP
jgi:hypothetical protein